MAVTLLSSACWTTASSDTGYGNAIYVDQAQFRPGEFPDATGGPPILQLYTEHATVLLGENREALTGVLDPAAHAAIVGIVGASGTWIVPAGPPDLSTPTDASLHATFGLADSLGVGPFTLEAAAVDASGHIGDPQTVALVAADQPMPTGALVVSLDWLGAADLDLHVIDPTGAEVWQGDPDSIQFPPGTIGIDPCAWAAGGILDHDANADCARAANPSEDVIWTARTCGSTMYQPTIPTGTYTVRVDIRSLCGDASEPWAVTVTSQGAVIGAAAGISTPYDVNYEPHGRGAGTTALQFSL
ncbi:MAG TPA: hypothetical protein VMJ10_35030 [Kofleriaceae bacterium]|nr:hypothetical protein [Kofleriaceae bacterium]